MHGNSQSYKDTLYTIYFETNSYTLDSAQENYLTAFAASVHSIDSILGYADTVGSTLYNITLSRKRAVAVYAVLSRTTNSVNKGILLPKGESCSKTELNKNRRVDLKATINVSSESIGTNSADTMTSFNVENVYFVPDKPIITQESLPYIQEVAARLQRYEIGTFQIIGHVNYQSHLDSSQLTDLYRLSEQRAKVVRDYLVEYGIPENKLTYKGVGNSDPLYPNPKNDDEKRKNMRVQIVVVK